MAKKPKPIQGPPDLYALEVRQIVASAPNWSALEKELYGGKLILILERRDVNGANEVMMLNGRLRGELRWIDAAQIEERKEIEGYDVYRR